MSTLPLECIMSSPIKTYVTRAPALLMSSPSQGFVQVISITRARSCYLHHNVQVISVTRALFMSSPSQGPVQAFSVTRALFKSSPSQGHCSCHLRHKGPFKPTPSQGHCSSHLRHKGTVQVISVTRALFMSSPSQGHFHVRWPGRSRVRATVGEQKLLRVESKIAYEPRAKLCTIREQKCA